MISLTSSGLPDFVYSTTNSSFTNRFRELIVPYDCKSQPTRDGSGAKNDAVEKLKQFDIDMSKGATTNADIIPPPSFNNKDVPFQYM